MEEHSSVSFPVVLLLPVSLWRLACRGAGAGWCRLGQGRIGNIALCIGAFPENGSVWLPHCVWYCMS